MLKFKSNCILFIYNETFTCRTLIEIVEFLKNTDFSGEENDIITTLCILNTDRISNRSPCPLLWRLSKYEDY